MRTIFNDRRPLLDHLSQYKWWPEDLVHMLRFQVAAHKMMNMARERSRPIHVMDIGCGFATSLQVLIKGYYAKKDDILASYIAVDVDDLSKEIPISSMMAERIGFQFIQQNLADNPQLPTSKLLDLVLFFESLEHISHQAGLILLDNLVNRMHPKGVVLLSTPNQSHGALRRKIYHGENEWKYDELNRELHKRWKTVRAYGQHMKRAMFNRVNKKEQRIPDKLVETFENIFSSEWLRLILAGPYPEASENVFWELLSPLD
jgi:2-polyprenyl-3-methyl-5-hydroxy-6-metoxy-1,4-benzoquinol methylase